MIVGVADIFALLSSENFGCAVGDDLVYVHICGGARSALNSVGNKARIQFARKCFVACGNYGVGSLFVKKSGGEIDNGCSLLYLDYIHYEQVIYGYSGNIKVAVSAQSLNTVVCVAGDFQSAYRIAFQSFFVCHKYNSVEFAIILTFYSF